MGKIFPLYFNVSSGLLKKTHNNCTVILQSATDRLRTHPIIAPLSASYSTQKTEVTLSLTPFKLHKLDKGPSTTTLLRKNDALNMYKNLYTIRKMEITASELYKAKQIYGFCHLYVGQEAVATGIHAAMSDVDSVVTAYRCHGWAFLMGVSVASVLSELTGRLSGCSRGKGGSMHMYAPQFYGGNGIVGAQVPLGAGVALAHKYKRDGGVCFILYGDGAANQGQIYETFNIAKLWKLPCVFICENNKYGMGTSASRSSAHTQYYMRGDYVPGLWVDGMDVLAVREAARYGIEHCAKGKGPIILEAETYRYYGHSMSDPGTSYRSRDEVHVMRQTRNAIQLFKEKIISNCLATAEEIKEIDEKVKKLVTLACNVAKTARIPPSTELASDVYVRHLDQSVRGTVPSQPLKHYEIATRDENLLKKTFELC